MNNKPEKRTRSRAIYLLPNLFTTSALFAGFYSIIAALAGNFEQAAMATITAMILDGLDGRVARLTNTSSQFGAEYDSLADMVSFGVAPALVIYQWSLISLQESGLGQLAWIAAFIYVACAALRLARFNVQVGVADKRFFQGLASPASAAIVVGMVWVGNDMGIAGEDVNYLALVVTVVAGLLMVSNFAYYSFKDLGGNKRISFMALLVVVLIFAAASIDPPKVIVGCFALYAASGPFISIYRRVRRRGLRKRDAA